LIFVFCGPATAQDLPPEILADQYMLEGVEALENGEGRRAIGAFEKIEALEVEPPAMFPFFYGKALVEKSGAKPDDLLKGQALLKRFVINTERGSEHYNAALQLLSGLERKQRLRQVPAGTKGQTEALRQSAQWTLQLFTAVSRGQTEEVQALIDAGADVNARDNDADNAYTPLHVAALMGKAEVAQVLIAAGAAVEAKSGEFALTPLHVAALMGKAEVAQVLIAAGAAVDARDSYAKTPLHVAAGKGHAEVAQVLIAAGADVNARDNDAITPLDMASFKEHAEVVRALKLAGASGTVRY